MEYFIPINSFRPIPDQIGEWESGRAGEWESERARERESGREGERESGRAASRAKRVREGGRGRVGKREVYSNNNTLQIPISAISRY